MINAPNNSYETVFVQDAKLNAQPYTKNYLTHEAIMKGGILDLKMSSKPNENKGAKESDFPFSLSVEK